MPNADCKQILYVWNYKEWGGAQIYFFGLVRRIKDLTNVKIVLPPNPDEQLLKFIKQLGVDYEFLDFHSDIDAAPTLKRKIERHLSKFKSEFSVVTHLLKYELRDSIIHIEFAPWQSFLALFFLCTRAHVFVTMHNSLPAVSGLRYLIWKIKFFLITRFSGFNMFPSNRDAKLSLKLLVSDRFYEKTQVTYTNVNPDEIDDALNAEIDANALKDRFQIPKEKLLVFCVGQFIDRKGRWTFLEAAKMIRLEHKDIAFVWISNSAPPESDLKRARSYGLGNDLIFITSDQVGEEHIDLFKLMRLADIFALVSTQEGLPISLLEAMALGIPSISTNVNAIPEAVKHMETGWLIESGDSVQLANAITTIRSDAELREKLAVNGRNFVLDQFNEKAVAEIAWNEYKLAFKKN